MLQRRTLLANTGIDGMVLFMFRKMNSIDMETRDSHLMEACLTREAEGVYGWLFVHVPMQGQFPKRLLRAPWQNV